MFTENYIRLRMFKHTFFHLKVQITKCNIFFYIWGFFALAFHVLCCCLFHFCALYIIVMTSLLSRSTLDQIKGLFSKITQWLNRLLLWQQDTGLCHVFSTTWTYIGVLIRQSSMKYLWRDRKQYITIHCFKSFFFFQIKIWGKSNNSAERWSSAPILNSFQLWQVFVLDCPECITSPGRAAWHERNNQNTVSYHVTTVSVVINTNFSHISFYFLSREAKIHLIVLIANHLKCNNLPNIYI